MKRLTKKAILEAQRAELGHCSALTEKGTECTHWAIDRVNTVAYCGQHIAGIVTREYEAKAAAKAKAATMAGIDSYLASTGQTAHECGARCEFSGA